MTYNYHLKSLFIPMLISRATPLAGITLVFALVAHKTSEGLAIFAYTLALFSIISTLTAMCLSATGNVIARPTEDTSSAQDIFSAGLYVSGLAAGIATLCSCALLAGLHYFPGAKNLDTSAVAGLASLYIACIPLTIINTFFHLFHESSGFASACSRIKMVSITTGGCLLGGAYELFSPGYFLSSAIVFFIVTEAISFVAYALLSHRRGFHFRPKYHARKAMLLLKMGVPIAVGLGGQKVYFYLLNERLAALQGALVAQLSVFMTVAGLLLLPFMALSQAHSLFVSQVTGSTRQPYRHGLFWLVMLIGALLIFVGIAGKLLLSAVGGPVLEASPAFFATMACFLVSNGLLALNMGHLRGAGDTLVPQLTVNAVIFAALVPVFYFVTPVAPDVMWYMSLQSGALFCIAVGLGGRICWMSRL